MPRRKPAFYLVLEVIVAVAIFAGAVTLIERWTDRTPHLNEMRSVWHPQKLDGARP